MYVSVGIIPSKNHFNLEILPIKSLWIFLKRLVLLHSEFQIQTPRKGPLHIFLSGKETDLCGRKRIRRDWVTKHTYTHILNIYSELLCDSAWGSQRDKCTVMFTEALFSIAKRWKQPKCPFRGMDKQSMVLSIQGLRMNTEDLVKQVLAAQLCPTLWDPVDCSPPGSSVHEILQVRILEWDVIPFSRGSSQPRDRTQVSCIAGRFFTVWATTEAPVCVY